MKRKKSTTKKKKGKGNVYYGYMIYGKKEQEKEFLILYSGLINDEQTFYKYFRITLYSFHWRKHIPSKEKT